MICKSHTALKSDKTDLINAKGGEGTGGTINITCWYPGNLEGRSNAKWTQNILSYDSLNELESKKVWLLIQVAKISWIFFKNVNQFHHDKNLELFNWPIHIDKKLKLTTGTWL